MTNISVQYIVKNVDESIKFYSENLNFRIIMHPASEFAILSFESFRLLLSQPGGLGGGGQQMFDGTNQVPGGWNSLKLKLII